MIQNIVFDIGNVLVTFDPAHYYQQLFQSASASICNRVFSSTAWRRYDDGLLSLQEVIAALTNAHPSLQNEIKLVCTDWFALMKPIDEMLQFRNACRTKGYGIYIISNLSEDSYHYLQAHYRLFDDLDGRILSFEEKFGKPDPRMYQFLYQRYHLEPSTCLFLDDRKTNIQAAITTGMHGIHVQTIKQAIKEVREIIC